MSSISTPKKFTECVLDMCGILGFLSNKGFIAQKIYKRKKQGFTIPIQQWMKDELYHFCQESLSNISDLDPSNELVIDKMWKQYLTDGSY